MLKKNLPRLYATGIARAVGPRRQAIIRDGKRPCSLDSNGSMAFCLLRSLVFSLRLPRRGPHPYIPAKLNTAPITAEKAMKTTGCTFFHCFMAKYSATARSTPCH